MAKDDDDLDRTTFGVLGDITPSPDVREHVPGEIGHIEENENDEGMSGGSGHDPPFRTARIVRGRTRTRFPEMPPPVMCAAA